MKLLCLHKTEKLSLSLISSDEKSIPVSLCSEKSKPHLSKLDRQGSYAPLPMATIMINPLV
jgi:hypothetical protein